MKYLLLALSLTFGTSLACMADEPKAPDATPVPIPAPHIGQAPPQVPQTPESRKGQDKETQPKAEDVPQPTK